jgi:hypothetical protein
MSDYASELIRSAALWFEPEMNGLVPLSIESATHVWC